MCLENKSEISKRLQMIKPGTIFYGAGQNFRKLLQLYDACGLNFDGIIWDVAYSGKKVYGFEIVYPDFEQIANGKDMIITISSPMLKTYISEFFTKQGYSVDSLCKFIPEVFALQTQFGENICYPPEYGEFEKDIIRYIQCNAMTMVSLERLYATISAAKYVVNSEIKGDFVECGVWRGGNGFAAAAVFKALRSDKKSYLFDNYEGYQKFEKDTADYITWNANIAGFRVEDVKKRFVDYGINENVNYIKGDIFESLNDSENLPDEISILRLDTGSYESTIYELEILYPRLNRGGVLLLDDYGYMEENAKAVEDYFSNKNKPLLNYIDQCGRLAIKV